MYTRNLYRKNTFIIQRCVNYLLYFNSQEANKVYWSIKYAEYTKPFYKPFVLWLILLNVTFNRSFYIFTSNWSKIYITLQTLFCSA